MLARGGAFAPGPATARAKAVCWIPCGGELSPSTPPHRSVRAMARARRLAPKSGVHSSGIAAGAPNYDRLPQGGLLKLWYAAATLRRPMLVGRLFFPTTERAGTAKRSGWGRSSAREKPALGTQRQRGEEEACTRTKSVLKRLELPQCARRNGTFETRLATLREGYRARTKNQKIRARQQMELPQRCRRPACKDRLPNGKADYQHHGGVQGRRGLLYKRK